MHCRQQHRSTKNALGSVTGLFFLTFTLGLYCLSSAPAFGQISALPADKSLWADEPVEQLAPAPRTERTSKQYSWEQQYAKTDSSGALTWTPKPFVFESGDSIRYIDFDNGRDSNDGKTKNTPWKHHPWDSQATDQAAACSGVHTYVFKRGVDYRSTLSAESRDSRAIRSD